LAFDRKNTIKNPDDKQTTPVLDPKKLLKPNGYLKSTVASTGKVYQPKVTQVNSKVQIEELTPEESFKQVPSAEASTRKLEAEIENPEVIVPEIKVEIELNDII